MYFFTMLQKPKAKSRGFTPLEAAVPKARLRPSRDGLPLTGFTLIELLVVIAIIGILAGIVFVFLGGARGQAKDGRITVDMGQLLRTAQIINARDGDYDRLGCVDADGTGGQATVDTDGKTLCADMNTQNGSYAAANVVKNGAPGVGATTTAYCIEIQLNSGQWYCIDSTFTSKKYTSNPSCNKAPPYFTCE